MIDAILALPVHLRKRLLRALESGSLPLACSARMVETALGSSADGETIVAALAEMESLGLTPGSAAVWIRGLDQAARRMPHPDLVWSGPEVEGVHARDTRKVFEELLGSVERTVWISTYAYFDGPSAFAVLARRMDERSDLRVRLLLNIQRRRGDVSAADELVRRFADRFWKRDWPGALRPRVYYDPRSVEMGGPTGVLHAKAVVVDDEVALVTSANLTEAALDRNFELGLLVRDRSLARSITSHFEALILGRLLRPLPP